MNLILHKSPLKYFIIFNLIFTTLLLSIIPTQENKKRKAEEDNKTEEVKKLRIEDSNSLIDKENEDFINKLKSPLKEVIKEIYEKYTKLFVIYTYHKEIDKIEKINNFTKYFNDQQSFLKKIIIDPTIRYQASRIIRHVKIRDNFEYFILILAEEGQQQIMYRYSKVEGKEEKRYKVSLGPSKKQIIYKEYDQIDSEIEEIVKDSNSSIDNENEDSINKENKDSINQLKSPLKEIFEKIRKRYKKNFLIFTYHKEIDKIEKIDNFKEYFKDKKDFLKKIIIDSTTVYHPSRITRHIINRDNLEYFILILTQDEEKQIMYRYTKSKGEEEKIFKVNISDFKIKRKFNEDNKTNDDNKTNNKIVKKQRVEDLNSSINKKNENYINQLKSPLKEIFKNINNKHKNIILLYTYHNEIDDIEKLENFTQYFEDKKDFLRKILINDNHLYPPSLIKLSIKYKKNIDDNEYFIVFLSEYNNKQIMYKYIKNKGKEEKYFIVHPYSKELNNKKRRAIYNNQKLENIEATKEKISKEKLENISKINEDFIEKLEDSQKEIFEEIMKKYTQVNLIYSYYNQIDEIDKLINFKQYFGYQESVLEKLLINTNDTYNAFMFTSSLLEKIEDIEYFIVFLTEKEEKQIMYKYIKNKGKKGEYLIVKSINKERRNQNHLRYRTKIKELKENNPQEEGIKAFDDSEDLDDFQYFNDSKIDKENEEYISQLKEPEKIIFQQIQNANSGKYILIFNYYKGIHKVDKLINFRAYFNQKQSLIKKVIPKKVYFSTNITRGKLSNKSNITYFLVFIFNEDIYISYKREGQKVQQSKIKENSIRIKRKQIKEKKQKVDKNNSNNLNNTSLELYTYPKDMIDKEYRGDILIREENEQNNSKNIETIYIRDDMYSDISEDEDNDESFKKNYFKSYTSESEDESLDNINLNTFIEQDRGEILIREENDENNAKDDLFNEIDMLETIMNEKNTTLYFFREVEKTFIKYLEISSNKIEELKQTHSKEWNIKIEHLTTLSINLSKEFEEEEEFKRKTQEYRKWVIKILSEKEKEAVNKIFMNREEELNDINEIIVNEELNKNIPIEDITNIEKGVKELNQLLKLKKYFI